MFNIRPTILLSILIGVCAAHGSYDQYPKGPIHGAYPMPHPRNPAPVPDQGVTGNCAGCLCCQKNVHRLSVEAFQQCLSNCAKNYRNKFPGSEPAGPLINGPNSGNIDSYTVNNANSVNGNDRNVNAYAIAPSPAPITTTTTTTTTVAPTTAPAVQKCICVTEATTTTAAPVPCPCTYVTAPVTTMAPEAPCQVTTTTPAVPATRTTTKKPCTEAPVIPNTVTPVAPCDLSQCPKCECEKCKECTTPEPVATIQTSPSPITDVYPSPTTNAYVTTTKTTQDNYGNCCTVTVTGNKAVIACNCRNSQSQSCESAVQSNQCSAYEVTFNRVVGYAQALSTMTCNQAVRQGIISEDDVRACHQTSLPSGNGNGDNNYDFGKDIEAPKENVYQHVPVSSSVSASSVTLSALTAVMAIFISY